MGVSRISSNSMVAQEAVSKLTRLDGAVLQNEKVEFSGSTVACMEAGQKLTNQMLNALGDFVGSVEKQAHKITGLAQKIEHDDKADSQSWGF
ncbi:TIGR04197 family type VII secretion effector [Lactococcus garvieae]|nr:TIGR04197 family type VII secretion effector [Lactococcus garvieae]